jgi:hypothetical protein
VNVRTESLARRAVPSLAEAVGAAKRRIVDAGVWLAGRASAARWSLVGTLVLWFPMLLWFLGNRPGFFTFDSFDVWRQASTGHW